MSVVKKTLVVKTRVVRIVKTVRTSAGETVTDETTTTTTEGDAADTEAVDKAFREMEKTVDVISADLRSTMARVRDRISHLFDELPKF
jgi:hypothetical protein